MQEIPQSRWNSIMSDWIWDNCWGFDDGRKTGGRNSLNRGVLNERDLGENGPGAR